MRTSQIFVLVCFAVSLAGCETFGPSISASSNASALGWAEQAPAATSSVSRDPASAGSPVAAERVRLGVEHFRRGLFGLAASYFQEATELSPGDATAWVGLAASYDRLGRFDLADRAYAKAVALVGETPEILNDLGYSAMLRHDLVAARKYLTRANTAAPNNPYVLNNITLLNASSAPASAAANPETEFLAAFNH
jgi:Flp pilus assembly protein TadD